MPTTIVPVTIQTVMASQRETAVMTLVAAFAADPVARWTYPDASSYFAGFPSFTRAFAGRAFTHNTAFVTENAAAMWLPPGVEPDIDALVACMQQSVPPAKQPELFGLMDQMAQFHPIEPHWYLPMIGTDPACQGMGLGSALLRHSLAMCDRDQLPAYLESSNPRNISLYERHGFVRTGIIQYGSSPEMTAMLRRPR
jgi:ribosomal protein S18 acetylase RimI-like enzyme